ASAGGPARMVPVERSRRGVCEGRVAADPQARREWEEASRHALRTARHSGESLRDRIRFPDDRPEAVAYRFALLRGQTLRVRETPVRGEPLFVDVFQDLGGSVLRPAKPERRSDHSLTFVART